MNSLNASRSLCGALLLFSGSMALAQAKVPIYFIGESFYWSRPNHKGATNRVSWLYGEAQINPNLKIVGSYLDLPGANTVSRFMDEGFVELREKDKIIRAGRIRARFGFGDWSELFYTPIAQWPMVRVNAINSLALLRFDTGFDVQGGSPSLQYQVGMLDVQSAGWQLTPTKLNHGVARLQTTVGDAIIGLNVLSKVDGGAQKNTMAGLDLRWSSPSWIARAEVIKGYDTGTNAEGSYFDVFYRSPKLFRTQFGFRQEYYHVLGNPVSNVTTLGLRQILSKQFALTVNHSIGNSVGPAANMKGWTVQLMTAVKF